MNKEEQHQNIPLELDASIKCGFLLFQLSMVQLGYPSPRVRTGEAVNALHAADVDRRTVSRQSTSPAPAGAGFVNPVAAVAEPLAADAALFDEIAQKAAVTVLVDFWAEWCRPCRFAAPEVSRTAADMAGRAVVLKVDSEKHPELAARFDVSSIPKLRRLLRFSHIDPNRAS